MKTLESLISEYHQCLGKQPFIQKDLDDSALEKYLPTLKQLSLLGNTGISVFDLYKKENVFTYYNFNSFFGYDQSEEQKKGTEFFNSRIHPEDLLMLVGNYTLFVDFLLPLSKEERANYKLLNQFRIQGSTQKYGVIIEQYQVMEFDKHGNVWLGLSVMDMAPDQNAELQGTGQVYNFKTGEFLPIENGMIKDKNQGVSKLSSALAKVNAQRKNMLEKINAENAADALKRVAKLKLVE